MKRVLMPACVAFKARALVRLADARGPEEHHVLSSLDEGESAELDDLLARSAAREGEVVPFERLDRRQRRQLQEHFPRALIAPLALGTQDPLEELTETRLVLHRLIGECWPVSGDARELKTLAALRDAIL